MTQQRPYGITESTSLVTSRDRHLDAPDAPDAALALVQLIERLRADLAELRRWMSAQLLIEEVNDALAERIGCAVDEAYARLVAQAADTVIAAPAPTEARPPGSANTPGEEPHDGPGDQPCGDPGDPGDTGDTSDTGPAVDADEFTCLITRLGQAQRLGNLGWSEWDLVTGTTRWSDQLYVIFGADPDRPPADLETFLTWVLPEDGPIAKNLMRRLLGRGKPVDGEFRIRRGRQDDRAGGDRRREEVRHLRVLAEPVLDAFGQPVRVRCVFQDVTPRRRAERSLAASRHQVERQRRIIEDERHIVVELQRAILPLPRGIVHKPGLEAAVRYLPAGHTTRVGGDWYETTSIDEAEVFLAIGDVSGHGLSAVAAMARLRNALSGLAFTGAAPDALLGWLNRVVLHWPTMLTATALAGRFDPATRILTWAQAGHLPPVLVHDGTPRLLDPPEGVLLGADDDLTFRTRTTPLTAGDLLMLYTDGLIERRDRDLNEGFRLLLGALAGAATSEPDKVIDHVLGELGAANPIDDTCLVVCRIH